jgi:hypothetical protein
LDWDAGELAAHGCVPAIGEDQVWRAARSLLEG